jgi:crotonobetainyl-CoA:carnitine CoA-transferase CaiB-like acyl-CoA transferase
MMNRRALEGVKVLDFTWVVAGPLMTKYLADYGGTVIRIESLEHPCFLRTSGPYKDNEAGPDRSGYFAFLNSNKYSMLLKLDHPRGLEVARRLVSWADIVAESFVPGTLAKLGLGYEEIRKIKPDIIMVSCSGQGQTGPAARVPIAGNWLVALSGFPWFSGWPDRESVQPFGPYTDFIAPRYGAVAVLAALRYKQRTGKGQYIDFSQLEAGIQFLLPAILDYTANRRQSGSMGNASLSAAPHGVYPCSGGRWCAISVSNEDEWVAFCNVIGNRALAKEPRFATLLSRKQNEDDLNRLVSEWTIKFSPEEVMTATQEAGVPAGVVASAKDLSEDLQLRHRNHFWTLKHEGIGEYDHLGQASILSKTPARGEMPSPCLGEHTEYVCKQFLSMSDEEFVELLNEGILGI